MCTHRVYIMYYNTTSFRKYTAHEYKNILLACYPSHFTWILVPLWSSVGIQCYDGGAAGTGRTIELFAQTVLILNIKALL